MIFSGEAIILINVELLLYYIFLIFVEIYGEINVHVSQSKDRLNDFDGFPLVPIHHNYFQFLIIFSFPYVFHDLFHKRCYLMVVYLRDEYTFSENKFRFRKTGSCEDCDRKLRKIRGGTHV